MKLRIGALFVFVLFAVFGFAQEAEFVPGEVVVKFRNSNPAAVQAAVRAMGVRELERNTDIGFSRIQLRPGISVEQAVRYYQGLKDVVYAEPNYIYSVALTPNDLVAQQYGPQIMSAPAAWDVTLGVNTVTIAIVDTGVQLTHPDLAAKVVAGYDFVNNDADPTDDHGHGTHCAGIAAAITNNGVGIAGIAPNCKIMPVKVLNSSGSGSTTNIANGVTWAVNNGAKVISMSLGGGGVSSTMQGAIDNAWNNGVVVVCAAGNNGSATIFYPAGYTNSIAVGSTDNTDARSSFSNYSTWVDVAAPGSSIYSTYLNSGYATLSGTSMACPHVAGEVGLLWSFYGTLVTPAFIRQKLEAGTDYIGGWMATGAGRANILKALFGAPQGTDRFPNVVWKSIINIGTAAGGNDQSFVTSDDNRYQVASVVSGGVSTVDLYFKSQVKYGPTPTIGLEVAVEGHLSASGSVTGYLYNYSTGVWDSIGAWSFATSDSVRVFTKLNADNYLDPDGEVQIRLVRAGTSTTAFTMRIDQVTVTRVRNL